MAAPVAISGEDLQPGRLSADVVRMEQPLLDVAMIVKNEEHFLPGCLESIAALGDLVHEVCIYDTGSTDRTIEIAETWGARVERGYWDDDFARAKNAAGAMCTAKWVLSLDADERVSGSAVILAGALRRLLTVGLQGVDACWTDLSNRDELGRENFRTRIVRLYRPSRCCFVGAVHEQVAPRQVGNQGVTADIDSDVLLITHHGYVGREKMRDKGARNVLAASRGVDQLAERPWLAAPAAEAQIQLARSERLRGNDSTAVTLLRDVYEQEGSGQRCRVWAGELLAEILIAQRDWYEAGAVLRAVKAMGSDSSLAAFREAQIRWGQGRIEEALNAIRVVRRPVEAGGIQLDLADVLDLHMRAAAILGHVDEAVAAGVALIAGHGTGLRLVPLMLRLWGGRDPELLAQLLAEADRGHASVSIPALDAAGETGHAVARHLTAALAGPER